LKILEKKIDIVSREVHLTAIAQFSPKSSRWWGTWTRQRWYGGACCARRFNDLLPSVVCMCCLASLCCQTFSTSRECSWEFCPERAN